MNLQNKKTYKDRISYYFINHLERKDNAPKPVDNKMNPPVLSNRNRFAYNAENGPSYDETKPELKYLSEMCENTNDTFCWMAVCGKGGTGKSRLALELCKKLSNKDWLVYYPSAAEITAEQIKSNFAKIDKDILICFDDVNSDIGIIRNFMNYCIETTFRQNRKIRLILIDRDFDYFQRRLSGTLLSYRYQGNAAADPEVKTVEGSLVL